MLFTKYPLNPSPCPIYSELQGKSRWHKQCIFGLDLQEAGHQRAIISFRGLDCLTLPGVSR